MQSKCKETQWNAVKCKEMQNTLKVCAGKRNVMVAQSVEK
jgi:hypothetical protein